ncbi:MAG: hypothetical protein ACLSE5_06365 [Enterococcus avium]
MSEHTINYNNLQYLALMRYGHQIGCGWYSILVKAEKELLAQGYSITGVEKKEGALLISLDTDMENLTSEVQNILYESELTSETTCEWCGVYTVSQTVIDKEICTICEGCQENCESLVGIEKRLLQQRIHKLEQKIQIQNRALEKQQNQAAFLKMELDHYKKANEKLKSGTRRPKIRVVTSNRHEKN